MTTILRDDAGALALEDERSTDAEILLVPLSDIVPDPHQARDEGADDEIGRDLAADEVLPAIELRVNPDAEASGVPYMILDGECRWRGSVRAGRTHIRAWVNPNPGDEGDILLRQAVLNNGRPLRAMEEARTWKRIMDAKGWNIVQLAAHVKKAKSTVSDRLAMLDAPARCRKARARRPEGEAANVRAETRGDEGRETHDERSAPLMPRTMNTKPVRPDTVLAAILGSDAPIQRTEITKYLWVFIKNNGHQDATDRRRINAESGNTAGTSLRALFDGRDSVTMFELTTCVSRHVLPVEG